MDAEIAELLESVVVEDIMDKLTLVVTVEDGQVVINCPELNVVVKGEHLYICLNSISHLIDDYVHNTNKDTPSLFVQHLYGGLDNYLESLSIWTYRHFERKLHNAFISNYPATINYDRIKLAFTIPFIDSDCISEQDELEQQRAYDGLISEGHNNKDWIEFVNWIVQFTGKDKVKHGIELGLPIKDKP